ncbi:proteasome maturation protein [Odontomachus brunneus]|uniref:proteasome maturation protein n=1 Tax=Odontomachus brunneus TaxID=486640 RepID=UPI0013F2AEC6|nr:proteasome maturation protein [Odontomachus brunneus]
MSFGLPSLIPKPTIPEKFNIQEGSSYGISSPMISGLSATKQNFGPVNQLQASEKNYQRNQDRMNMVLLKNTQGLHAPLRIAMELKATEKIGRLPFLSSSNVMRDVLLGKDQDIGFEDIFNTSEFREQMGQPHAVVENHFGFLL